METTKELRVAVIYGSYRSNRQGIKAARYAVNQLAKRCSAVLVDAQKFDLPMLDKMHKEYSEETVPDSLHRASSILNESDAFMVIAGEYNHSIQPGLKNFLDHFQREYYFKPAAILTYSGGSFGGVRATAQLRSILGELGMVTASSMLPVPYVGKAFSESNEPLDDKMNERFARFADELLWYASALKKARALGTPY